ncbi:MAG TPA: hypothetical protein VK589_10535 [Chryseolinea sp.]|nr:hypothetical protein [Chryseolinea sp.]
MLSSRAHSLFLTHAHLEWTHALGDKKLRIAAMDLPDIKTNSVMGVTVCFSKGSFAGGFIGRYLACKTIPYAQLFGKTQALWKTVVNGTES